MFRNRIFLFLIATVILFLGFNILLDKRASSELPDIIEGSSSQSSYYSQSQYYSQSNYYNQSSYSPEQSQYYSQSSYSPSYSQSQYYAQSSYVGKSPNSFTEVISINNIRNQIKALQILLSEGLRARMNYTSDSLLTMTPAELTEYIRSQKDPRKILVASHNLLHPTDKLSLADTEFKYSLSQMTNGSLRAEILRAYSLQNINPTQVELQQLDSQLQSLNPNLSKATAFILKAQNDASIFVKQNISKLSQSDREFVGKFDPNIIGVEASISGAIDNLSVVDRTRLNTILNKLDHVKTAKGAGYMLDAVEKAKATLDAAAEQLGVRNNPLVSTASASSHCASGSVVFEFGWSSTGACLVVIGGTGGTTYSADTYLSIDLGFSGDTYNNSAGGAYSLWEGPLTSLLVDLGGSNYYRCTTGSNGFYTTCGAGFIFTGIIMDYGYGNYFNCGVSSCGDGRAGGIGIVYEAIGGGGYIGGRSCSDCLGIGLFGGTGIFLSEAGGNGYQCGSQCAGRGGDVLVPDPGTGLYTTTVGLGILIDTVNNGWSGAVSCTSNCNGSGIIGISNMMDTGYLQATYYLQAAYIPYSQVTYSIYTQSAYQPYLQASYAGLCQGPQGQPGVNIGGTCYSLPSLPPPCTPPQHTWPLCIDPLPYLQATYNIYTQAAYIPYVQSSYYQQSSYYTQSGYYNQSQYYAQTAY